MPAVTTEQIAKAKEWDLLSYLEAHEPHELKRSGPNEYCTRIHDSLKISNGKWCWSSRGIGGRTALDYLIKVRGIHPELLQACIQAGTLYENRKYQNCVFVGKDPTGRARFACLRGTRDSFRIDAESSDKRYNFSLLAADPD